MCTQNIFIILVEVMNDLVQLKCTKMVFIIKIDISWIDYFTAKKISHVILLLVMAMDNPRPSHHESPPIATRPGLPPHNLIICRIRDTKYKGLNLTLKSSLMHTYVYWDTLRSWKKSKNSPTAPKIAQEYLK